MKLTKLAALFFLPLALFAQVNVQKQQGTNALTNGSIVVPSGMSISATGTGTIIATNTSGSTSGTSILYGNGSGGFSNVTIGTGLTFSSGTLASTASGGTVTSVGTTGTVNGITLTGGPITSTGNITLGGTLSGVSLTTQVSGTLPVANGGTGVTSSSGANSVVLRDSNSNASVNNLFEGFTIITASGTTVTLTVASAENFVINGSGGQIIKLPDATTLSNGTDFIFNNNQSSGTVTIQNNSATTVCTLQSGSYIIVTLLSNSTAAGTWDYHNVAPSNASWSTNTLSWAGSFTNGTWNGNVIGALYGGTGTTGLTGYVYGNGTSAMTASTTIPTTALSGTVTNAQLANSAITIAGTATALGGSISQDTITGLSTTGIVKRTGANTLAIATSGSDYAPATTGNSAQLLANNGTGGFSNVNVGTGLSLSAGTLTASGSSGVTSITGTTNQVIASSGTGNVTLSLPQSIATTSTPQFGTLALGAANLSFVGLYNTPTLTGATLYGEFIAANLTASAGGSGAIAFCTAPTVTSSYAGGTYYGYFDNTPTTAFTGSGSLTYAYMLYIASAPTATLKYGIFQNGTDPNQLNGPLTVPAFTATGTTTLATSLTGVLKSTSGVVSVATANTDYLPATTGNSSQLLGSNGSGGLSNISVGSGLTLSGGVLTSSGGGGGVTTIANGGTGATTANGAVVNLQPGSLPVTESSGAITLNWAAAPIQRTVLNANATVSFNNANEGQTITAFLTNNATSYTVTWPTGVLWAGGNNPTMTASSTDSYKLTYINGSYYGQAIQNYSLPLTVTYLVVAGGGGGGAGQAGLVNGGGGGGGGLLSGTSTFAIGTTYIITIGSGGASNTNGQNSIISAVNVLSLTAIGGGSGGGGGAATAGNGGSGGGAGGSAYANAQGSGTPGQGNNGGAGTASSPAYGAGGGGGAGAVGGTGSGTNGGNGGVGLQSSITGVPVYYAGGGGGSSTNYTAGTGGSGGGGNGSTTGAASTGTVNTGGGGGGSSGTTGTPAGAAGGSGIIIISAPKAAASTTGSPTVTTSGGNTIYTFTGSGTITY